MDDGEREKNDSKPNNPDKPSDPSIKNKGVVMVSSGAGEGWVTMV